jgi:hypothetical protein
MPDNVVMVGWAVTWCQKRIAGNLTQNVNEPKYINDPNKTIQILYDETIDYGFFFKILRKDPGIRPFIRAELKIDGITDPIFFTNTFNEQHIDPKRAHVEIPFGPEDKEKSGKLYWPSKDREFHKIGIHTLVVSLGSKKNGQMDQNPPEWNPKTISIPIEVTDIIKDL